MERRSNHVAFEHGFSNLHASLESGLAETNKCCRRRCGFECLLDRPLLDCGVTGYCRIYGSVAGGNVYYETITYDSESMWYWKDRM